MSKVQSLKIFYSTNLNFAYSEGIREFKQV